MAKGRGRDMSLIFVHLVNHSSGMSPVHEPFFEFLAGKVDNMSLASLEDHLRTNSFLSIFFLCIF